MSSQGWIKLHRKLIDNPIFNSEKGLKIWIWCLFKAGHQGKSIYIGQKCIKLQPGQFVYGRESASDSLKMSQSTVRNWMNILKKDRYLDIKATANYSIITILNWSEYQTIDNKKDNKITREKKQKDTNNNIKNDNKDIIAKSEDSAHKEIIEVFDCFRPINPTINYGNKTQRGAAEYLIKQFGLDATIRAAKYAVSIQGKDFAPTITHPYELKEKWSKIGIFIQKQNSPKNKENKIITLKDGTKVIKKFGQWVSANDNNVKVDLSYYPELREIDKNNQ